LVEIEGVSAYTGGLFLVFMSPEMPLWNQKSFYCTFALFSLISCLRFDFFIVVVGFLEMTPAKAIFEYFPVVVFRLLRLLRVFRLAKALPRLRSIVQALISGFAVVSFGAYSDS